MNLLPDVRALAGQFQLTGELLHAEPFGSGHINHTYRLTFDHSRFILQRLNTSVFQNPAAVMENIRRVTTHLVENNSRTLALVPARDGKSFYCDTDGNWWRVFPFIERTRAVDVVESPAQAFAAAKAFGAFQKQLADLPAPRLHETIPDFHHTPKRFSALEKAVAADACNRAAAAKPEIEFALRHQAICGALLDADLPERVTHNDTKLNNVLLDETTGEGVCVIDLDTVMPGLALYDFGDMVRSMTNPAAENERDLAKVEMQFPVFEALLRGYLAAADFLTPAEKNLLPISGQLITFELGLRFLSDFLSGDNYFKVQREGENLDRCRAQFKLFESIRRQESAMSQLVAAL
ncbi:MAG: aminoglycoside phosphotransferase family protein [Verrucomicrobiae bacterium]